MDAPLEMRPGSVTIAYCYGGPVEGLFLDSVVRLASSEFGRERIFGPNGGGVVSAHGTRIARNRNDLCSSFLAGPGEWLLMIDTDHTFSPDTIENLVASADPASAPIVGGLCFAANLVGKISPTMYRMHRLVGSDDMAVGIIERWKPGTMVEVHATGAAFLVVHRTVLEAMRSVWPGTTTWFYEGVTADGIEMGEDFFFCQRARRATGAPIFVNTACEAPHVKPRVVSSADYYAHLVERDARGEAVVYGEGEAKVRGDVVRLTRVEDDGIAPRNRAERRAMERAAR